MAKMNNLLASFVIACASLAAAGPFFSEPEHGDMLRTSFDLSEARHDWNSERWWIECLFVDLDGDGVEEMASSTVSQSDRSGSAWSFWRMESGAFCRLCARNGVVFGCHPRSYYKLCVGNGLYRVVLLGITAGALDGKRMMKPESMFADRCRPPRRSRCPSRSAHPPPAPRSGNRARRAGCASRPAREWRHTDRRHRSRTGKSAGGRPKAPAGTGRRPRFCARYHRRAP